MRLQRKAILYKTLYIIITYNRYGHLIILWSMYFRT